MLPHVLLSHPAAGLLRWNCRPSAQHLLKVSCHEPSARHGRRSAASFRSALNTSSRASCRAQQAQRDFFSTSRAAPAVTRHMLHMLPGLPEQQPATHHDAAIDTSVLRRHMQRLQIAAAAGYEYRQPGGLRGAGPVLRRLRTKCCRRYMPRCRRGPPPPAADAAATGQECRMMAAAGC